MSARLLQGKALAEELNAALPARAAALARRPGLAVVLVGQDPASQVYVRQKGRVAERAGFYHVQIDLPADTSQARLIACVRELNADPRIDGILVQLPLPPQIEERAVIEAIDPRKDVDGFHPENVGLLWQGRPRFVPCTPLGVMRLLERSGEPLSGREAVVVGRSNIVGKPMAALLLQADCSVSICHSRTRDLPERVRQAEVVIAAVGRPRMIKGDWIRPGATVIDVGINRLPDGTLCGDVDFEGAVERAGWITPVPGGVGPMTIAMLMENTLRSAAVRQ